MGKCHTHTHTNECAPCEYGGGKKSHGKKFIGSGICFDNNLLLLLWFRFTIQSANYAENLILCLCMWPHGARGKDMHITQLIFRRQTQNLKLSWNYCLRVWCCWCFTATITEHTVHTQWLSFTTSDTHLSQLYTCLELTEKYLYAFRGLKMLEKKVYALLLLPLKWMRF